MLATVEAMGRQTYRFRPERMVELRKAHGWNETELAARVGVTATAIRKWEAGKWPKTLAYVDLCVALGVDFEELIEPIGPHAVKRAR